MNQCTTPPRADSTVSPQSSQTKQRAYFPEADVIRAAAMVFVVGIYHVSGYSEQYLLNFETIPGTSILIACVMGAFFAISGFLLAMTHKDKVGWPAYRSFLSRRLFRLYPLYLASLIACYLLDTQGINLKVLIAAALLVSVFLELAPNTLWFVNVIFIYYAVIPGLVAPGTNRIINYGILFAVWLALLIISITTDYVDFRLVQYFPSFVFGTLLAISERLRTFLLNWKGASLLAAIGIFIFGVCKLALTHITPAEVMTPFLMLPIVWKLSGLMVRLPYVVSLSKLLGYLAFAAYVTHRITYELFKDTYLPDSRFKAVLYWYFLAAPIALGVGWLVQWGYDECSKFLLEKKPKV